MSPITLADNCERMARILADAPLAGLSMDEIQAITEKQPGDTWSLWTINYVLCAMRSHKQITFEKVRTRNGKVSKYSLKKGS